MKQNALFCSQAFPKNTNHFSKILLAYNEATYQFPQVTHNKMQCVRINNYTTLYTENPITHIVLFLNVLKQCPIHLIYLR